VAERESYSPGIPSWLDIGADVAATKAFYGELFGWSGQDAGPPEQTGGYGFFTKGGKMVAGYGPQQSPGPPAWAVYVATADADETARRVEQAGGKVVMAPMDVMGAGRMAVFQDPQGAFFSAWQAGDHKGAQLVGEAGALCWVELIARDTERAKQFYPAVFGWTAETHEDAMPYTEFHLGPDAVAGMMAMSPEIPQEVPPYWFPYFGASDVDGTSGRGRELGAAVLVEPNDIPGGGRFAVLRDPLGAVFGLFEQQG
jgi:predicted enzyme related to lactoylglutathione lyase